jgi:RimJ/RimL family protein N-acetyltransferase
MSSIIKIREATESDAKLLYQWQMDPDVRQASIKQQSFSFDSHCDWLRKTLNDSNAKLYIALYQDNAVGMLRLNQMDQFWRLSILVAKEYRGRGFAESMLKDMVELSHVSLKKSLDAIVRKDNLASLATFTKSGWLKQSEGDESLSETTLFISPPKRY